MDMLSNQLIKLADHLDKNKLVKCANEIDDILESRSLHKTAQYVGVIGYVLKQNRAMMNCIRKKRTASNDPMQKIVLGCLQEYQDGQDYHNTEWTKKYAEVVKRFPGKIKISHIDFITSLGINQKIEIHTDKLMKAASTLSSNGITDSSIHKVLNHLSMLLSIVHKEADSKKKPLKLSAVPAERGWWDRFVNPEEVSKNPFSWSEKGRDRGKQKEIERHIDGLTNNLT